jgi:hypothetical protein
MTVFSCSVMIHTDVHMHIGMYFNFKLTYRLYTAALTVPIAARLLRVYCKVAARWLRGRCTLSLHTHTLALLIDSTEADVLLCTF